MHLVLVTTFAKIGDNAAPTTQVIEFTTEQNAIIAVDRINRTEYNKIVKQHALYLGEK